MIVCMKKAQFSIYTLHGSRSRNSVSAHVSLGDNSHVGQFLRIASLDVRAVTSTVDSIT